VQAFDIEGLGEKVVEQLMEYQLVEDLADIFVLTLEDLLQLPLFKEKRAGNVITAIDKSREISLERPLYALGIRHVGEETAIELAHFIEAEKMNEQLTIPEIVQIGTALRTDQLEQIEGFGNKVAKSVCDWFHNEKNQQFLEKLNRVGVRLVAKQKLLEQKLSGKAFVVTGSLSQMSREEAKTIIRQMGGKIQGSVGAKTDFLVCGENPGTKAVNAKKLSVPILTEQEFLKMVS
jgi:DNA ligase (NAD+)